MDIQTSLSMTHVEKQLISYAIGAIGLPDAGDRAEYARAVRTQLSILHSLARG